MVKVYVGMSGGVDSSVSAALLKKQGHSVTGAFIKIWQPEFIECTWREDRLDAMRVAAALDIPFKEIDLSEEYRRAVVERMVAAYERGETPNPDVLCNSEIKFGVFMKWALESGAEYVATGHYARAEAGRLFRGIDGSKDQSYFLHRLTKENLKRALFPVGDLQKTQVRKMAMQFDLPVATKHDSQGLCFVGDITLPEFLGRHVPLQRGIVRDEAGTAIGEHEGALVYTKGQRHGFSLSHTSDHEAPHYVVSTDVKMNEIIVSKDKSRAESTVAHVDDMQWIGEKLSMPTRLLVQTRYRETPEEAELFETSAGISARFMEPRILSRGQSLVIYAGDQCLGGGPIVRTQ